MALVTVSLALGSCGGADAPEAPLPSIKAAAGPVPGRAAFASMRGMHMAGDYGASTTRAMRLTIGAGLAGGGALTAGRSTVQVFVNTTNGVVTSELAQVRLENVALSTGVVLPAAGFWLGRDLVTGNTFLQLRPSLDPNLSGVPGFAQDVTVMFHASGAVDLPDDSVASGTASQLSADVVASAARILGSATVQLNSGATFDQAQQVQAAQRITDAVAQLRNRYFDRLHQLNADWVGISVGLFVDSVSDPTVRVRLRIPGREQEIATWDDAELLGFMARAREQGIKVYITLALEQPNGDASIPLSDPRCKTPQAPVQRYIMGNPTLFQNSDTQCISASDWWWSPTHPEYARKKAIFWQTYTDLAAKYAQIAQQGGAELYSLGTETDWLFRTRPGGGATNDFAPELHAMMDAVRAVYSGRVTYDQHIKVHTRPASVNGGEWGPYLAADLGFDVIGLSAYIDSYPTSPTQVLSVSELEQNFWAPVFDVLARLQAQNPGKPIVFTEVGVDDDIGTPHNQASNVMMPVAGRDAAGLTEGMRQQANIYTSFFNVDAARGHPVAGAFFWASYMVAVPGPADPSCALVTHLIVCSPPAFDAIRDAYATWRAADAQRVFDWAQHAYDGYFPGSPQSGVYAGYTYRYYAPSGTYLGYKDGSVFVHNGRDWNMLNLGPVAPFADSAAGAGF